MAVVSEKKSGPPAGALVIGLVNNMPDAALEATERQFRDLLDEASGETPVVLRLFSLPAVLRGEFGRHRIAALYAEDAALWRGGLDGLIVTGAEPGAPDLSGEAYWPQLVRLLAWAESHTLSSVWSCLAAHAAVQQLAGVRRRRLARKCSGVFAAQKAGDHPLNAGLPERIRVPHSRYNGLDETEIAAAGFTPLTRSAEVGVDVFLKDGGIKEDGHLFLFVQGHPEYEEHTLLREYRRDIGRFLRGERDAYPDMPQNYFDAATARRLEDFRAIALADRREDVIAQFPPIPALDMIWRPTAIALYRNWLALIAERKIARAARPEAPRTQSPSFTS